LTRLLNYEPDRAHVFDGDMLMCAHHTAIYRPPEGSCVDGRCTGARLASIPIDIDGGDVRVA